MDAVLLGLLAGALFGAMTVAVRAGLVRGGGAAVGGVVIASSAFVVAAGLALPSLVSEGLDLDALWPFAAVGLIVPGLSQLLFILAVRHAGPSRAAILVGTAPLGSVLLAMALLDEPLRPAILVGTYPTLVIGAALTDDGTLPALVTNEWATLLDPSVDDPRSPTDRAVRLVAEALALRAEFEPELRRAAVLTTPDLGVPDAATVAAVAGLAEQSPALRLVPLSGLPGGADAMTVDGRPVTVTLPPSAGPDLSARAEQLDNAGLSTGQRGVDAPAHRSAAGGMARRARHTAFHRPRRRRGERGGRTRDRRGRRRPPVGRTPAAVHVHAHRPLR